MNTDKNSAHSIRVMRPLFHGDNGGSIPTCAHSASQLRFDVCNKRDAVLLVRCWHSRLPNCPFAPWTHAFCAEFQGVIYAVALWNNCSTRCLPAHWRELRRMACAPDIPPNSASRFLGWMVRWFRKNHPQAEKLISYQDTAVHNGTIYKAAGWKPEFISIARARDRSKVGKGLRIASNGLAVDQSKKIRWSIEL